MRRSVAAGLLGRLVLSQAGARAEQEPEATLLIADRVFDGETVQEGWAVLVRGARIEAAGPAKSLDAPPGARTLRLTGQTLMPGLIEGHSHLLLHPYNETSWNDQVLRGCWPQSRDRRGGDRRTSDAGRRTRDGGDRYLRAAR